MLSWFRKHAGSRWAKALYGFIAVTFFGGFGILSSGRFRACAGGPASAGDPVAIVDGVEISYSDLYRAVQQERERWMRMMRDQYEGGVPFELVDSMDFKSQVMDKRVEQIVLLNKAREWGLEVSDAELRKEIASNPYFRDRMGRFNRQAYLSILSRQGISEAGFEDSTRQFLLIQKLLAMVGGSAHLLEGEARERYIYEQEKINLEYMSFDIDERFKDAKPTEDEIREYYEGHQDRFDLPETRRIRFFRFHVPDYEDMIKLGRKDIQEFYEDTRERYLIGPEKAEVRHIFLKVGEGAPEERIDSIRAMAEDLVKRAREGADFVELARTYSEDAATRDSGGYLGEVIRGRLIAPVEEAIFALEPGEISEPVLTPVGFYIFKVEDKTAAEYMPLSEVEGEVRDDLLRAESFAAATLDANTVMRDINAGKTMEDIAEQQELKLYESEFFYKEERNVPDIPDIYHVASEAFFLDVGQVSSVISGLDDLYIIEVMEVAESHQASLEESRDKIERLMGPDIRRKRALDEARGYLEELKSGTGLKKVARDAGVEWKETGLFPRASVEIPGIGYSEELKVTAFRLGPDNPWPEDVYEVSGKIVILHFREKEEPDLAEFDEDPESFENQMLYEKQDEIVKRFIEGLKKDAVEYKPLYDEI